jgi:hypothetical protein
VIALEFLLMHTTEVEGESRSFKETQGPSKATIATSICSNLAPLFRNIYEQERSQT